MRGTLDVHHDLLAREVTHEVVSIARPASTCDDIPAAAGLAPTSCVAVRVYRFTPPGPPATRFVAALVQAGTRPQEPCLLRALAERLRGPVTGLAAATSAETSAATDYRAGLVSPVGLPPEVVVVADAALTGLAVLYVPTGDSGTVVGIPTQRLLEVCAATVHRLVVPVVSLPTRLRLAGPTDSRSVALPG